MRRGLIVAALALLALAVLAMGVLAYGRQGAQAGLQNVTRAESHERMEAIAENGTFADLVALRNETGRLMMPWVQDEESFARWQEHHEEMEALYGEGPRVGRGRGGCPMMDDAD